MGALYQIVKIMNKRTYFYVENVTCEVTLVQINMQDSFVLCFCICDDPFTHI